VQINVISKDDLIRNKLASGPEQDVLDVKKLQAALERRQTNEAESATLKGPRRHSRRIVADDSSRQKATKAVQI